MSTENDIQKKVLEKIRAGEVSMRPRYYFAAQAALIGLGILAALAVSVFALSFGAFSIHEGGEEFLLGFGTQGLATFAALFPWGLLLLSVALLALLEVLMRNFRFAYRTPVLRTFLGVGALAIIASAAVSLTSLHPLLAARADHDELPLLGPLYEQIRDSHQPQGVYRGHVVSVDGSRFVIAHDDDDHDEDDGSWVVESPAGFDTRALVPGTWVYVAGQLQNGIVYAYGVRVISSEDD